MSFRIIHPRPQAGRQSALGVDFTDGVAEVAELHPERRQALLQHGHTVEEHIVGTKLEDLTIRELRDVAEVEGIELPSKGSKAELIDLINRAPGIPALGNDSMPVQIMLRGEEVEIGRIQTDVATARYGEPGSEV